MIILFLLLSCCYNVLLYSAGKRFTKNATPRVSFKSPEPDYLVQEEEEDRVVESVVTMEDGAPTAESHYLVQEEEEDRVVQSVVTMEDGAPTVPDAELEQDSVVVTGLSPESTVPDAEL